MPTTLTQTALVQCRGLTKQFGRGEGLVHALRETNLNLHVGALTLLVGPSGCGKTTLISLIAGLLDPTSGEVHIAGTSLTKLSARDKTIFRRRTIGFVFQQHQLLPALSAVENVAVSLIVSGMRRRLAVNRAKDLLVRLGLAARLHAFPNQLSHGQQQRVAIARALIHEPRLLLCDEPTAALDAHSGQTVMELLRETAMHPDRSIVVVTHDSRIFGFGDRTLVMDDGQIVRDQSTRAVR